MKHLLTEAQNGVDIPPLIQIATLIPDISPTPTYTDVSYNGSFSNWQSIYPSSLNLFINQTINNTTPVSQIITVDQNGNFSFTAQVIQYPTVSFAISDSNVYGTGYLETDPFSITTIVGPINAYFNNQSYVITTKPTNYSILLQNWDPTYTFTKLYVHVEDDNNNLLWNYGPVNITMENNIYYLIYGAIIDNIETGLYNVYISDTDYNTPEYNILQLLTNKVFSFNNVILEKLKNHLDFYNHFLHTNLH
jgi:hypothetical protein